MAVPPRRRRWSRPAAEAGVVLVALLLAFAAGAAGFVIGRETADEEPAAAETTAPAETSATTELTIQTETAETETQTETDGGEDADGAAIFAEAGCGGCHVFEPAGSSGTVGPPLDGIDLSKDEIATQVRDGGGGMPAFGDRLSDEEIDAVADYVESG